MVRIDQAVIFAGGRGERLRPLTDNLPKPMVPVSGKPFMDYLLQALLAGGIRRILFLVGYCAEKITGYYSDRLSCGVPIEYSIGTADDLTGRRLLNAYDKLDDHFLLLYGDNYWPLPLNAMISNYERLGLPATTTVFSNKKGTGEYGFENNVVVGEDGKVKMYDKSRSIPGLNGVDMGFFIMDKKILNGSEKGNISFEEKILTRLASDKQLGAFVTDQQYYYITNMDSLKNFERYVFRDNIKTI